MSIRVAFITLVTLVGILSLAGCLPYFGTAEQEVRREKLEFRDAGSGSLIPRVLSVPLYTSFAGVGAIEADFFEGSGRVYFDGPFIHDAGRPFILRQPNVAAFGGPMVAMAGRAVSLILVIAPGYRCEWIVPSALNANEPWESLDDDLTTPVLRRIPLAQAKEEIRRLRAVFLLAQVPPKDTCPEQSDDVHYSHRETRVEIRFDDQERALVQRFFDHADIQLQATLEHEWNAGIPTPTVPLATPTFGPLPQEKLRD